MKKVIFKVSSHKNDLVISLIKEVNKLPYRIYIDFENESITVENTNDAMIQDVIELISNYYTILSVDIDNSIGEVSEGLKYDLDKPIEKSISKLLKTSSWALYARGATENDICKLVYTSISEMSMKYASKPCIDFTAGDIVDVRYGYHLPGEISGNHVQAIVCNILSSGLVYVVPIARTDTSFNSCLFMDVSQDTVYNNEYCRDGIVLVSRGNYVNAKRFQSIVGKTTTEFFKKVSCQLASTFDFEDCLDRTSCNEVL